MRTRLTITLQDSVIERLDSAIDGVKIRNRSHAIEYFLNRSFYSEETQAVILVGGEGSRMRPYTYEMPKCMLLFHQKPLLEHTIELLRKAQIKDILLCIGTLGEQIKEYFGDGSRFGVRIRYCEEKGVAGTGGALLGAEKFITTSHFLLLHGDVLTDIDTRELLAYHQHNSALVTMALKAVKEAQNFGQITLKGNKITAFYNEQSSRKTEISNLINTGIYVMSHDVLKLLNKKVPFALEDVLTALVAKRQIAGYVFDGRWFDVGTPEDYEKALKAVK